MRARRASERNFLDRPDRYTPSASGADEARATTRRARHASFDRDREQIFEREDEELALVVLRAHETVIELDRVDAGHRERHSAMRCVQRQPPSLCREKLSRLGRLGLRFLQRAEEHRVGHRLDVARNREGFQVFLRCC